MGKCKNCDIEFEPNRNRQVFCSRDCKSIFNVRLSRFKYKSICIQCGHEYFHSSKKQLFCSCKCNSLHKSNGLISGVRKCACCGESKDISVFKKYPDGKIKSYCPDCTKSKDNARNYKRRNHTIVINSNLDILAVFRKYKWICQDCGCSTPKELRGTFLPNSPELDHIIPISKGGEHTYRNVQLLCRKCNLKKGNKIYATSRTRTNSVSYQARPEDILQHSQAR